MGSIPFAKWKVEEAVYLTQTEVEYWNRKGWYPQGEWYMDHSDHKEYLIWRNKQNGAEGYLKLSSGPMLPTVDHLQISREPAEQTA